jgi:hypothetical protein
MMAGHGTGVLLAWLNSTQVQVSAVLLGRVVASPMSLTSTAWSSTGEPTAVVRFPPKIATEVGADTTTTVDVEETAHVPLASTAVMFTA